MTEVNSPNQMICLKFQQGDRQGDSPAPQKFIIVYDRASDNLMTISETFREERAFCWTGPFSGKDEIIDRARYADDLSTVGLASNPKPGTWRVHDWDNAWSLSFAPLLLQHNAGKRQFLVNF
eukprot:2436914-Heterocapsa_arctica.AAC.1